MLFARITLAIARPWRLDGYLQGIPGFSHVCVWRLVGMGLEPAGWFRWCVAGIERAGAHFIRHLDAAQDDLIERSALCVCTAGKSRFPGGTGDAGVCARTG